MKKKETLATLRAKLAAEIKMHEREETSLRLNLAQQKDEHERELAKCAAECLSHKARADNWEKEAKRLANNEAAVRDRALDYIKQLRNQIAALNRSLVQAHYGDKHPVGVGDYMKEYELALMLEQYSGSRKVDDEG